MANTTRSDERAKLLALRRNRPSICHILNHIKSNIVPGRGIAAAWISQSDDKPHHLLSAVLSAFSGIAFCVLGFGSFLDHGTPLTNNRQDVEVVRCNNLGASRCRADAFYALRDSFAAPGRGFA